MRRLVCVFVVRKPPKTCSHVEAQTTAKAFGGEVGLTRLWCLIKHIIHLGDVFPLFKGLSPGEIFFQLSYPDRARLEISTGSLKYQFSD